MADTIEIIGGVHSGTKRLTLKSELERFGDIDICHKVGDPVQHRPWVRFRDASGAQRAMDGIAKGEVRIDGVAIQAQWKERGKDQTAMRDAIERKGQTSRDIFLAEQERRRGGGGSSRDLYQSSRSARSRSRSDRRQRGSGRNDRDRDDSSDDRHDRRDRHDDRGSRHDDRRQDRRRDHDDRGEKSRSGRL
eukprot:TRINITY_DN31767_c0_g1_i1.p1 TRINITY_DN31767_c0_g1~~TRINITY_DN31767_c0_g1_i1.p1  ORF type:complete len:191 (+),score=28.88 TRINITY_DN31767_c0_g1_i1:79-651(+)